MQNHIIFCHEAGICELILNRPEKKNAITQDMYQKMADAIRVYDQDDSAKILMIRGEGDYFTSGNDLRDFAVAGMPKSPDDFTHAPGVMQFLQAMISCKKPLMAVVNGPGVGIGLTMLLHCDLVYAADNVTFKAPFVELGLVPEAASSLLLPQAVGMAVANDILLAGRIINAQEALAFGLVARLYQPDVLKDEAMRVAKQICEYAPNALMHSKALIRDNYMQVSEKMLAEGHLFVQQLQSADFKNSVRKFMQKRRG